MTRYFAELEFADPAGTALHIASTLATRETAGGPALMDVVPALHGTAGGLASLTLMTDADGMPQAATAVLRAAASAAGHPLPVAALHVTPVHLPVPSAVAAAIAPAAASAGCALPPPAPVRRGTRILRRAAAAQA